MVFTKDALIGFFVIFVLIGGLIWLVWSQPSPLPVVETPPPEGSSAPGHIDEVTEYYEIHLTYPGRTPLYESAGASADAQAVATMKAWQEEQAAEFKKNGNFDAIEPGSFEASWYDQGRKQELGIDYELFMGSRTVSYEFTVYMDTFGAHPNAYMHTVTFDATTGEELTLADVFDGKTAYLAALSEKSRAILAPHIAEASGIPASEFDASYLNEGTEPVAENFSRFYFDDAEFVVVFPPYQVGPWVIGRQEARFPKAELSAYLRPEYR